MLEKLGLPPKPSLKGNEWVIDASHCQGCSSAFSFFNRKHHCRRCGGIFCGNCTQQRMNLRGQGDGPVRICDPCKKLEDAARLESRFGHRHKGSKGASKSSSSIDTNPLLKEILGRDSNTEGIEHSSLMDGVSELIARNAGSTSIGDQCKSDNDGLVNSEVTPESLHQQAQEQKQQWLALKKEGRGDEALRAFKRSKELERQAENLKLSIRKTQRKAMASTTRKEKHEEVRTAEPKQRAHTLAFEDIQSIPNNTTPAKSKKVPKKDKEKKDDLMDALKELGWNDAELQDAGGKQNKAKTVESELAELAAAVHPGSVSDHRKSTSSMEVLAHKRKALSLKREGHLAEAKEELKKAKLLEKQLEEQELLGGEEYESDDDLHALMRDIDKDGGSHSMDAIDMDFSVLGNIHEEDDEGVEVSDVDMDDPEMIAALKSVGWEEEAAPKEQACKRTPTKPRNTGHAHKPQSAPEGLDFLGGFETSLDGVEATEDDMKDPYFLSTLKAMGFEEEEPSKLLHPVLASAGDKKKLQQEILFLKREALALKRAGNLGEAKEELRRAKQLERELQEVASQCNDEDALDAFSVQQQHQLHHSTEAEVMSLHPSLDEDAENVDVTEEDMGDPELAETLKALGWQDDPDTPPDNCLAPEIESSEEEFRISHKSKSKSELQKELLGIKRAALKLRREGKTEEAEDELKKAHILEQLMEESSRVSTIKEMKPTDHKLADRLFLIDKNVKADAEEPIVPVSSKTGYFDEKEILNLSSLPGNRMEQEAPYLSNEISKTNAVFIDTGREGSNGLDEEHFQARKVGINLASQPAQTEAAFVDAGRESSNHPNEVMMDPACNCGTALADGERKEVLGGKDNFLSSLTVQAPASGIVEEQTLFMDSNTRSKEPGGFSREPLKKTGNTVVPLESSLAAVPPPKHALQQEVLSLKRQALALRRDGRQQEAKDKLKEAKLLERMLVSGSKNSPMEEVQPSAANNSGVEPLPSPATSTGASSVTIRGTAAHKSAGKDRMKLQQESLTHKRKALALRREGKAEAADMEFELAKSFEKQMEELEEHSAVPQGDDLGLIDDIFDPQLLSALKGLGWKENDIRSTMVEVRPETAEQQQDVNHKKSIEVETTSIAGLVQTNERAQLEQRIRTEKIRAVQLKRSGQQAEALEVLRGTKLLERRLQSLS